MLDALPRHVGDVQQAIDAAQVNERTVVGEILDRALHHGAFLQVVHERAALGGELLLDHRAARHHDVIALLVQLDDLELERLAFEVRGITHRAHIDERARQERADILDLDGEATLDAAGDHTGHDLGIVEGRLQARPGAGTLGLLARQTRLAIAILNGIQRDLDHVASLDFELTALVLELFDGDDGFGLQSDVDDDDVIRDIDHQPLEDHPGTDALVGETISKSSAKLSVIPSTCTGSWLAHAGIVVNTLHGTFHGLVHSVPVTRERPVRPQRAAASQRQHLFDHVLDTQVRGIDHVGVGGGPQGRDGTRRILEGPVRLSRAKGRQG